MHPKTKKLVKVASAAITMAAVVTPATGALAQDSGPGGLTRAQRQVVREATERFRDVDTAIAAGYLPSDACAALPGVGGMGYHFVNPALSSDAKVDPTTPEILVYRKLANGRFRLSALEWFVADADQDVTTDVDRPTLMGHPFDGPMAGHEPGMPVHYDLHAWVYQSNPAGELSAWNPDAHCN